MEIARCPECGRVERIDVVETTSEAHGNDAVLGGVVGGVLSNPAGNGGGKVVKHSYRISVRMGDGRLLTFSQGIISPNLRSGSQVFIDKGRVVLLR